MILVFYWKSSAILPRFLSLHCQFVYAVAPVSQYFLSLTDFSQFLSFKVFFKHFFCVFWNMNLAFDTDFFGFVFLSFVSWHTYQQNFVYHRNCTYKLILRFSWFYRTFGAWGQNFYLIFQEWNLRISEQKSSYFFWWLWYLYCVVSKERFEIDHLFGQYNNLFLSVCRLSYWSYPHLFQKIFAYPMNIWFSMRY